MKIIEMHGVHRQDVLYYISFETADAVREFAHNSARQRINGSVGALGALCTWPSGHTILDESRGPNPAGNEVCCVGM